MHSPQCTGGTHRGYTRGVHTGGARRGYTQAVHTTIERNSTERFLGDFGGCFITPGDTVSKPAPPPQRSGPLALSRRSAGQGRRSSASRRCSHRGRAAEDDRIGLRAACTQKRCAYRISGGSILLKVKKINIFGQEIAYVDLVGGMGVATS